MNQEIKTEPELNFDYTFLHIVHDIMSKLESGGHDVESLNLKLNELQEKIKEAKNEIINIDYIRPTKEHQELQVQALLQQLKIKQNLLNKYEKYSLSP